MGSNTIRRITVRDYKHIHEEKLQREDLDYRAGWNTGEAWAAGFLWGIVFVVAVMVFWP